MPILAGQFTSVTVTDVDGAVIDLSPVLTQITPTLTRADATLTTFAAGGGPAVESHRAGALMSEMQAQALFEPWLIALCARLVGKREGTRLVLRAGTNAAPTVGDERFSGVYVLLSTQIVYNTGAPATVTLDFKLADGAAAPSFGVN
jgi:hypothetical protein